VDSFDDILDRVSRPSRYLGSEVNTVLKAPADVSLHMALAFPDLYDIGTSHFGMQILYDVLNRTADIYAERVFAPADDMARMLSENKRPLFSLETKTPLGQFDIIGFSLLYDSITRTSCRCSTWPASLFMRPNGTSTIRLSLPAALAR